MNKVNIKDYDVFMQKSFWEDIKRITETSDEHIDSFYQWIKTLSEYSELKEKENWLPIVNKTKMPIEDLSNLIGPINYIANVCTSEKCSIDDLLSELLNNNLLDNLDKNLFTKRINLLGVPVLELLRKQDKITAPSLPLLYLKKVQTNIIFISEFDKEFSKDEGSIDKYDPFVERIYPRVILELGFYEEKHDNVGVVLSKKTIESMIERLEASKKKLEAAEKVISSDKLIID